MCREKKEGERKVGWEGRSDGREGKIKGMESEGKEGKGREGK